MFEADDDITVSDEAIREDLRDITAAIKQTEKDDGKAFAYLYCGDDEGMKVQIKNMIAYAMVRDDEQEPQDLRRIDYFLPAVTVTPKMEKNLSAQNYVLIGFIDNHYDDVFGICNGCIPDGMEYDVNSLPVALYGRLSSISEEQAEQCKQRWWEDSRSSITAIKNEFLPLMQERKEGLMAMHMARVMQRKKPGFAE